MKDGANRIEGVDNISSDNPLAGQDSRQEEKQVLHVRLPKQVDIKGQPYHHGVTSEHHCCGHEMKGLVMKVYL